MLAAGYCPCETCPWFLVPSPAQRWFGCSSLFSSPVSIASVNKPPMARRNPTQPHTITHPPLHMHAKLNSRFLILPRQSSRFLSLPSQPPRFLVLPRQSSRSNPFGSSAARFICGERLLPPPATRCSDASIPADSSCRSPRVPHSIPCFIDVRLRLPA